MAHLTTAILSRLGILDTLRQRWRQDQKQALDKMRARAEQLDGQIASLTATLGETERELKRLKTVVAMEQRHRADSPRRLADEGRVTSHVSRAIDVSPLDLDPTAHMVVTNLLPPDTYEEVVRGLPPRSLFQGTDSVKLNMRPSTRDLLPDASRAMLHLVDQILVPAMIPAIWRRFEPHLREHLNRWTAEHGASGSPVTPRYVGGRLMLRRRGYALAPHIDPSRVLITGLLYLARPEDDEAYGTSLYRMHGAPVIDQTNTFYPETQGITCEHVRTVPFRPNTALVFLNAGAAHGASIPKNAPPDTLRYAYQFYLTLDRDPADGDA